MFALSCWNLEFHNGSIRHAGILRAADERRRRVNDSLLSFAGFSGLKLEQGNRKVRTVVKTSLN